MEISGGGLTVKKTVVEFAFPAVSFARTVMLWFPLETCNVIFPQLASALNVPLKKKQLKPNESLAA